MAEIERKSYGTKLKEGAVRKRNSIKIVFPLTLSLSLSHSHTLTRTSVHKADAHTASYGQEKLFIEQLG